MNIDKILENNKIIADFMGDLISDKDGNVKNNGEDLYYHTSWDWLMPVVEKIERTEFNINHIYDVSIGSFEKGISSARRTMTMTVKSVYFKIEMDEVRLVLCENGCTTDELYNKGSKLENIYKAIIDFIKWHNENK